MGGTSTTTVAGYRYTPLPSTNSTRFLELLPATDPSDELRCRLNVVDFDKDLISYEALSYTWGDGEMTHHIYVSIEEGWRVLRVTENLWTALHRFRKHSKPRMIWADAVCINQGDVGERDSQIPGMVDIYRSAKRVLVWLGTDSEKEKVMARLSVLGNRILRRESELPAEDTDELASCASTLLSMPWFSRRWVIQEVVFSPDVVLFVGAECTSFLRLVAIIKLLHPSRDRLPSKSTESFLAMYQLWNQTMSGELSGDCGLLRLMRVFDHFGCADPVDRIFTIASLAQDVRLRLLSTTGSRTRNLEIIVDQRKTRFDSPIAPPPGMKLSYAKTPEQVFTHFAEFLAHSGRFVWVLGQALARADGATRASGLPSWVPDWRSPRRRQPLWIQGQRDNWQYSHYTNEMRPSEGLLSGYDEGLFLRYAVPPTPAVVPQSDGNGHHLRAAVCHTHHWASNLEQYVKNPMVNTYSVPKMTHAKRVRMAVAPLRHDMLFPLSVGFKTGPFPEQGDLQGVVDWIRDSFLSLLSHVLPPQQFSIFMEAGSSPQRWKGLPGTYLERFAFVITASGMFIPQLSHAEQNSLRDLGYSFHIIGSDKHGWYGLDPQKVVPILARILGGSKQCGLASATPLQHLISTTMAGRCVISCDYVTLRGRYSETGRLREEDMAVLGIASSHTAKGDTVMSLFKAKGHWGENDYSFTPCQQQSAPAAPPAVDSFMRGSSNLSFSGMRFSGPAEGGETPASQRYWTRTYVVRRHGLPGGEGQGTAGQGTWLKGAGAEDIDDSPLCRIRIPQLDFVGDCFLSTHRWEPELFRPPRDSPQGILMKLAEHQYAGDLDSLYKTASSTASVLEFHLV
ncbi:hypothetical protein RB595_004895 [Gaeumannomyces hyphopodioides]